jgi:tRNA A-37 threonylcarbamoyl transferase component Bud32
MQRIHDAGVCHNDLSYGNLLVNDAGEVTILDFDRADLISSKGARKRELARLADTLDGNYFPPDGFSSDSTTPMFRSRSASTETPTNSVIIPNL